MADPDAPPDSTGNRSAQTHDLPATGEELKASNEFLRARNAELTAANESLKSKLDDLSRAHADFSNLMAATGVTAIFLDQALRITRYTPSAVALFRLTPSDLGRPLTNLHHRLSYPELKNDAERVLEGLIPVKRDISDGERWYFAHLLPCRAVDDRVVGIVLTFVDITATRASELALAQDSSARQRAEEALGESQRRLQLAQEAGEVGIWDWFIESGETFWSEILWKLFGYADSTGLTPRAIWKKHLLPEDRERVDAMLARLLASRDTDFRTQFRIRCPDGRLRWIESVARVSRDETGRAVRMMGVNFEITERKTSEAALRASEERLRLIVENAREYAIFSMDLDRRITSWNSGAEAILGYTQNETMGQPGDIIFTPEDRQAGAPEEECRKALAEGRASDERWHLRKDGTRFWGSGVMMPMRNYTSEAIGLVKIFRDQTKELHDKEALEQSQAQLWEALQETEAARAEAVAAGQAKDHFLAVLSHELRTPLTPVMMAASTLARRDDLPEPVRDALEMIRRNIVLESRFVDDLLDITRISRGKMELHRAPMDVHEAIVHAVEISHPDIDAKQQRLTLQLDAPRHRLEGDLARLQQAVWNLLKNASKFTPPGGAIRIRTANAADGLLVEVVDSGIGIAPDDLPRIFDAFAQANIDITRKFGGLGLGLAIAKAAIDAHGGSIRVASKGLGQGATFTISLPLAASAD